MRRWRQIGLSAAAVGLPAATASQPALTVSHSLQGRGPRHRDVSGCVAREGRCHHDLAPAASTARCSWRWCGNSRTGCRRPRGCSGRSRIRCCCNQGCSGGSRSRYWCGYRTSRGSWYRCSSSRSRNNSSRRPGYTICGCYCQGMHACAVTSTPSLHNGAHVGSERSQPGAHGSSSRRHLTPQASGQVFGWSSSTGSGCSRAACGCCRRGAWPWPCRGSNWQWSRNRAWWPGRIHCCPGQSR